MRKVLLLPVLAIVLTAALVSVSVYSEHQWSMREYDRALREVVALPSIAIGTNYEGTRNPLIEVFVRSLYDVPGGYDYIVSSSFIDTPTRLRDFRETIPGFNFTAVKG
ncbi:MAG: hypothetical protein ABC537_04550 [Candidatus Methanosuratincola sp.]